MANRKIELKKRNLNNRPRKPVFLIVAEGINKTERLYFSHFQNQEAPYTIRFVSAGHATDADSLYRAINNRWKELGLDKTRGDKAFVVLDIDNDPVKNQKVSSLVQKSKSIEFIISNPGFEVWFLLHFTYTTRHFQNCDDLIKNLKKYIPDYDKNVDVYERIDNNTSKALLNVDKLDKTFVGQKWPSLDCNPRTDVGKILRYLNGE